MNNSLIAWILLTLPFVGWYCLMMKKKTEPYFHKYAIMEAISLWWGIYFFIKEIR